MALSDFKEYALKKKVCNVAVCIYPKSIGETDKSHINRTLERLQKSFLEKKEENLTIQAAYVFGEKVVYSREFQTPEEDLIYYADYGKESASLSHIWFMGMVLLEKKMSEDQDAGIASENYLYLLTDRDFPRSEAGKILTTPRFRELPVRLVLIKSEEAGGGSLEDYIEEKEGVYLDTEF